MPCIEGVCMMDRKQLKDEFLPLFSPYGKVE